jgi:hypothetical protein
MIAYKLFLSFHTIFLLFFYDDFMIFRKKRSYATDVEGKCVCNIIRQKLHMFSMWIFRKKNFQSQSHKIILNDFFANFSSFFFHFVKVVTLNKIFFFFLKIVKNKIATRVVMMWFMSSFTTTRKITFFFLYFFFVVLCVYTYWMNEESSSYHIISSCIYEMIASHLVAIFFQGITWVGWDQ